MFVLVLRVLAATLAFMVVQGVAASITSALFGAFPPMPPGAAGWVVLSNLLTVAVLAILAVRSRLGGIRLAAWVALLHYGIGSFNSMIEAVFFNVFGTTDLARYLLMGALVAIGFAPLLVVILGRWRKAASAGAVAHVSFPASPSSWAWRLAAADVLYFLCYFGAGIVIFPFVREFYLSRELPSRLMVAAVQLLFRGPVFIAIVLLALRFLDGERWERSVLVGAMLSILGGVAPLLIPNPYIPDSVRWPHFFETGISNFVYGWAAAWLLTPPPRPVAALAGSRA
jgi:hypothetical protein